MTARDAAISPEYYRSRSSSLGLLRPTSYVVIIGRKKYVAQYDIALAFLDFGLESCNVAELEIV